MMDELNENFYLHIHQLNVEMFDNYQDFLQPISIRSKKNQYINNRYQEGRKQGNKYLL